jgi:hypothetical protein
MRDPRWENAPYAGSPDAFAPIKLDAVDSIPIDIFNILPLPATIPVVEKAIAARGSKKCGSRCRLATVTSLADAISGAFATMLTHGLVGDPSSFRSPLMGPDDARRCLARHAPLRLRRTT